MDARSKLSNLPSLLSRHAAALGYVLGVVLPVILRTGRRPVIFSRDSGMGDIICSVAAARELMKRHPGAPCIYNCHAEFADVPRLAGVAGRVTSLRQIGVVGYWYRFLLAGFYHFAHGDDLSGPEGNQPMVAQFLRQFDLPVTEEHPALPVTAAAREKVLQVLARKGLDASDFVLVHPGPSWLVREWPRENWVRLVAELRARGVAGIGQLGVGRHLTRGKVEEAAIPGAVSLVDEFNIEECIALIAQAKLFIGIDSGPLHIAACVRTPSVGIFGMTFPELRFSKQFRANFVASQVECAGCEHRKPRLHWMTGCPYDIRCMKQITVEEVLRACLAKLPSGLETK